MDSLGIPWYSTGTVDVTQGSSNVTGVGTNWLNAGLKKGDIFTLDKIRIYQVWDVESNTSITLQEAFQGATGTAQVYFVIRNFAATMQAEIAAQVAELVNKYESYIDTELKQIVGPAGPTSFPYRGTWATGRSYNALDVVQYGTQLYMALYGHTSTSANAPGATSTAWTPLAVSLSGTALVSRNVTLYVATDGNDATGDGTAAKPFATINHAIDQLGDVMDNCTILVKPGTYTLVQANGDYGGKDSPIHIEGKQGTLTIRSTNGLNAKDIIFRVTDNRNRNNQGGVVTVHGFVTLTFSSFVIHLTGPDGNNQSGLYADNGGNINLQTVDIFGHGQGLRFILCAGMHGRILKINSSIKTLISFDLRRSGSALLQSIGGFISCDNVALKTPEEGETVYGPQFVYATWYGGIIVSNDSTIDVSPYGAKYYTSNYLIYPASV